MIYGPYSTGWRDEVARHEKARAVLGWVAVACVAVSAVALLVVL